MVIIYTRKLNTIVTIDRLNDHGRSLDATPSLKSLLLCFNDDRIIWTVNHIISLICLYIVGEGFQIWLMR